MNLRDLERMTEAIFGHCPGCEDCPSCRAIGLVRIAWETGRRSGSASAADRSSKFVRWEQWDWTRAKLDLLGFSMPTGSFATTSHAMQWIEAELQGAEEWAKSKAAKRADWTAFMKSWLRRRLPPPLQAQPDLFAASSLRSSEVSPSQTNRKSARSAAAMRLLKGGKH